MATDVMRQASRELADEYAAKYGEHDPIVRYLRRRAAGDDTVRVGDAALEAGRVRRADGNP